MKKAGGTRISGWGRYPQGLTNLRRPERLSDLRGETGEATSYVPRGLGRSYGDASFNSSGRTILMERLNRFLDFDPASGIVECEAGVRLDELLRYFVPRGFFPPVVPGTKYVTLGGSLACDVHGKNHHRDGQLSRHVLDFKLLTPGGELIRCSRDENSDLFWATIGGMGLTGVITELRLKLVPIESAFLVVDYDRAADLDGALELMDETDQRYKYSVAWVDGLARGRNLGRSVLMSANPASSGTGDLSLRERGTLSIPSVWPGRLLNGPAMRAFNSLYYERFRRGGREVLTHFEPFFFPLDRIGRWNRLYGRTGFVQYQCVIPGEGGRSGLVEILERFARSGQDIFLAVLKRLGSVEREHLLAFPLSGYTLAVDLPCRDPALFRLLDEVDRIVVRLGGRVYLAKDARMSGDVIRDMYPNLDRWAEVKARVDPDGRLSSDLARRLRLAP